MDGIHLLIWLKRLVTLFKLEGVEVEKIPKFREKVRNT